MNLTTSNLKGKTIVIVGGTSGIGLAAAQQSTVQGANVIVVGTNRDRAEKAATDNNFFGWRVADVTNEESIKAALSDIPQVDHLVLMAGSFVYGNVMDADMNYLRRAFEERIWGGVYTLRALGDRLTRNASVTFISGSLSDRPIPGTAILAAASAAMEALTRGLVLELSPRRFNTLSPGSTDTPLLANALGEGRDAYITAQSEKLPLHRLATAEQAGAAIVFLMTNEIMNGETIHVDGGQRLV